MTRLIRYRQLAAALLPLLAAASLTVTLAAPSAGRAFSPNSAGTRPEVQPSKHLAYGPAHTSDGSARTLSFIHPAPGSEGGGCPNPDGCPVLPANSGSGFDPNGGIIANYGLSMDPNGGADVRPRTDTTGPTEPNGSADCTYAKDPNGLCAPLAA